MARNTPSPSTEANGIELAKYPTLASWDLVRDHLEPPEGEKYIKRPPNPYMLWVATKRPEIVQKNPKLRANDVSVLLGELWKKTSEIERRPYFEKSQQMWEEHKKVVSKNPHLLRPVVLKKKVVTKVDEFQQPNGSASTNGHNSMNHTPKNVATVAPNSQPLRQILAQPVTSSPTTTVVSQRSVLAPGDRPVLRPGQRSVYLPGAPLNPKPLDVNQCLDLYYIALCEPAFPQRGILSLDKLKSSGEVPLAQASANFYWERYNQLLLTRNL